MADNIDEEHLDSPTNTQPDNPLDDISPTTDTETITQNQETENMEVHHHPDLHHKPKKWKEYFLEFLMIFLAVSLGFIAENLRESLVNKEKEKKYMENLVRDLKEQEKSISETIKKNEDRIISLDTFVKIRNFDFSKKSNNDLFFKLFGNAQMWDIGIFKVNEVTLMQIKSTGSLNIIRPKIADLIAELDMSNQNIKWGQRFSETHAEETERMIYELTDYPSIWDKNGNLNSVLPPLMIDDKKKLMKFFNLSADLMYTIQGYNDNLKDHSKQIEKLIITFKHEYNLTE